MSWNSTSHPACGPDAEPEIVSAVGMFCSPTKTLLTNKDNIRISRRYISADAGKRHARGQQQGRHNQHHTSCYLLSTHVLPPFIISKTKNKTFLLYFLPPFFY
jgi:hypothetical protein